MLARPEDGVPRRKVGRAAAFEVLFPADEEQYELLNKMALIGVWVVSSIEGMLPISGAYYLEPKQGGGNSLTILPPVSLRRMKQVRTHEESSEAARRFGHYSQELFFFIPLRMLAAKGEFGLKFGEAGEHLPVARLPIPVELPFFKGDSFPYEDPERAPDLPLAAALIEKYYCHKHEG